MDYNNHSKLPNRSQPVIAQPIRSQLVKNQSIKNELYNIQSENSQLDNSHLDNSQIDNNQLTQAKSIRAQPINVQSNRIQLTINQPESLTLNRTPTNNQNNSQKLNELAIEKTPSNASRSKLKELIASRLSSDKSTMPSNTIPSRNLQERSNQADKFNNSPRNMESRQNKFNDPPIKQQSFTSAMDKSSLLKKPTNNTLNQNPPKPNKKAPNMKAR